MPNENDKNALVEAGCAFWFNDNDHGKSPFPSRIQAEVKRIAEQEYRLWLANLTDEDQEEVTDDEMVSVFERFLFDEALKLVGTDDPDLVLTLHYPLMPRVGDLVNDAVRGESRVIERCLSAKKNDKPAMVVILKVIETGTTWQTEFLLPP